MAIQKAKLKGKIDEDMSEEEQVAVAVEEATEEVPVPATKPAPAVAAMPELSVQESEHVTFAVYTEQDPAPTIGHPAHGGYSFIENGIPKLEARKSYTMPRRVAEHLADKKVGTIVG